MPSLGTGITKIYGVKVNPRAGTSTQVEFLDPRFIKQVEEAFRAAQQPVFENDPERYDARYILNVCSSAGEYSLEVEADRVVFKGMAYPLLGQKLWTVFEEQRQTTEADLSDEEVVERVRTFLLAWKEFMEKKRRRASGSET